MEKYIGSQKHLENLKKAGALADEQRKNAKRNRIEKYNINPNHCFLCNIILPYEKRNNKFCSSSCSAKLNNIGRKHSSKTKERITQTLIEKCGIEKTCKNCNGRLKRSIQKFCSISCSLEYRKTHKDEYNDYYEKLRMAMKKRVKNGTHSGWKSRNKITPSYPEKYFIEVFTNMNIQYEREKKMGKYFIDFAFSDKKIAVEIDGKQHLLPLRKRMDKKKDSFLMQNGWKVIRIQWINPINEKNKKLLYNQIYSLKKILLSHECYKRI